jgi:hypothetical protein
LPVLISYLFVHSLNVVRLNKKLFGIQLGSKFQTYNCCFHRVQPHLLFVKEINFDVDSFLNCILFTRNISTKSYLYNNSDCELETPFILNFRIYFLRLIGVVYPPDQLHLLKVYDFNKCLLLCRALGFEEKVRTTC